MRNRTQTTFFQKGKCEHNKITYNMYSRSSVATFPEAPLAYGQPLVEKEVKGGFEKLVLQETNPL